MLNDKQSLILTGFLAGCIFVFGLLKILNNFVVLTILTIVFFTIVINIFYTKSNSDKEEEEKEE